MRHVSHNADFGGRRNTGELTGPDAHQSQPTSKIHAGSELLLN